MKNLDRCVVIEVVMVFSVIVTALSCSNISTGDKTASTLANSPANVAKPSDATRATGTLNDKSQTNVDTAPAGAPDLIITDIWLEGPIIYYKVKNIGKVESTPTTSYLYINGRWPTSGGSSFVAPLKPGEERGLSFSSYAFTYNASAGGVSSLGGGIFATTSIWEQYLLPTGKVEYVAFSQKMPLVQVCADSKNEVAESSEANNCTTRLWGSLVDYDLLALSHLATFNNGTSSVPAFSPEGSPSGSIIKMSDGALQMTPEQIQQGFMQGYWGYFYTGNSGSESAPIKIPVKAHLVSRVGLSNNARGSDGVIFKIGLLTLNDNVNFIAGKKMITPGIFEDWDIDLGGYEGQIVYFVLRVEADVSPVNDYAIWKEAHLKQVN